MTRRRTSVIGPGRAQAFTQDAAEPTAPGAAPDPQTLWRWSLAAARELSLSLDGDPATEAQRLAQAKRRWDIAHGRLSGNPEESAGRSEVKRIEPSGGLAFWRKRFDAKDVAWQLNETGALTYLGTVDAEKRFGLRDHVGWMRNLSTGSDGASSLQVVETLDAGPNLGTWREWAPCSEVHGFALPLFAQASFVAALARQLLIGLEKLTRFEAVHNDIKPNNLCLAMPQKRQHKRTLWQARVDLQHPSLRLIDFELAFVPDKVRLTQTHNNPWVSPFARACHAKAAVSGQHEQDRAAILSAIDWGADLWSLGHLLDEWWEGALAFQDAWLIAVGETFGDGSPIAQRADQLIGDQADAWQPLKALADALKAQDRPLSDAGKTRLPERVPTHAVLRAQLESAFPLLTSGRSSVVEMHWIDPHAPLHAPPAGRWRAALRRAGSALRSAVWRRRKPVAAAVVAGVLGATVWANAPALQNWGIGQIAKGSHRLANDWWMYQGNWRRVILQTLVNHPGNDLRRAVQAGLLRSAEEAPSQRDIVAAFSAPTQTDTDVAAIFLNSVRNALLRTLIVWHWSGADLNQPAAARRVVDHLQALYAAQNQLEKLGRGRVGEKELAQLLGEAAPMFTDFSRRWPLATLMAVRLEACYTHGDTRRLDAQLATLLNLPASAESASVYRGYASVVKARLNNGASPCLIVS